MLISWVTLGELFHLIEPLFQNEAITAPIVQGYFQELNDIVYV